MNLITKGQKNILPVYMKVAHVIRIWWIYLVLLYMQTLWKAWIYVFFFVHLIFFQSSAKDLHLLFVVKIKKTQSGYIGFFLGY